MSKLFKKYMPAADVEVRATGEANDVGHLVAKFTTFRVQDSYGDIIHPKALDEHDGSEVALVWSHDWKNIVGKGVISKKRDYAVWEGDFFLDTAKGQEAYQTVKAMGSLMEYSWGFFVDEATPIDEKGNPVKDPGDWWWGPVEVTKATPIEVSPVLKGANPITGTMSIKGVDVPKDDDGNLLFGPAEMEQLGIRRLKSAHLTLPQSNNEHETTTETPHELTLETVSAWLSKSESLDDVLAIESLLATLRSQRGVPIGERFRDLELLKRRSRE